MRQRDPGKDKLKKYVRSFILTHLGRTVLRTEGEAKGSGWEKMIFSLTNAGTSEGFI